MEKKLAIEKIVKLFIHILLFSQYSLYLYMYFYKKKINVTLETCNKLNCVCSIKIEEIQRRR